MFKPLKKLLSLMTVLLVIICFSLATAHASSLVTAEEKIDYLKNAVVTDNRYEFLIVATEPSTPDGNYYIIYNNNTDCTFVSSPTEEQANIFYDGFNLTEEIRLELVFEPGIGAIKVPYAGENSYSRFKKNKSDHVGFYLRNVYDVNHPDFRFDTITLYENVYELHLKDGLEDVITGSVLSSESVHKPESPDYLITAAIVFVIVILMLLIIYTSRRRKFTVVPKTTYEQTAETTLPAAGVTAKSISQSKKQVADVLGVDNDTLADLYPFTPQQGEVYYNREHDVFIYNGQRYVRESK